MVATPKSDRRSNPSTSAREGQPNQADAKRIVFAAHPSVKQEATESGEPARKRGRPKSRRQSHGPAWHWKQTDAWYYTLAGTKKRVPLFDEE